MDSKIDHSAQNIADQRAPFAAPCAVGISLAVRADLPKLTPELRQGVLDVVKRKNS
jgi:hypothetical protein